MTRDRGVRAGLRSDERERLKELEREVRELRRAKRRLHQPPSIAPFPGRLRMIGRGRVQWAVFGTLIRCLLNNPAPPAMPV